MRWIARTTIGLWLLSTSTVLADEACKPSFEKLRYDEDVSCYRDPARHDGPLDRLKYIALDQADESYLSLGGEIRQRYEYTQDPLFGDDPQDKAGVWLQRYTLHGDLHLGGGFRLFGQLLSALEAGRKGGPSPVDENELELQNGFAEIRLTPADDVALMLRGGRQELFFGSGRLIDRREGPNLRRTFDAGRVTLALADWRVDALAARPRAPERGIFDDDTSDDQGIWGVYASGGRDLLPAGSLDLYYLRFSDDAGAFQQGTAGETRHSVGARLWGDAGAWIWNWEAVYQFGDFGDGDIRAWTVATETGRSWPGLPWRPEITLNANIASGDDDPDDADLGTFNPLFPRGNYFSEAAVLGPRNFFNIHPFLTVSPAPDWSVTADVNFFWRLETDDGVYSPSGQLIRAGDDSDARFVGSAVSLAADYAITDRLAFTAIYTRFFAGDFIDDTGPDDDIDFLELTLQFKF